MEYTFTWFVENFSYCFSNETVPICSPIFSANGLSKTDWRLRLNPSGSTIGSEVNATLAVQRMFDGPDDGVLIKYDLSFLREDGLVLVPSKITHYFKKGYYRKHTAIISRRLPNNVHQDTLIVRCTMSKTEVVLKHFGKSCARTRIGIKHVSSVHVVEDFSTLEQDQKMTSKILSPKEECPSLNLYLAKSPCCDGRLMVEIQPLGEKMILTKCKISLLDARGEVKMCGEHDNRCNHERKEIKEIPLFLRKEDVLNRRDEYLLEDKLSLFCECTFYTGEEIDRMEQTIPEIPTLVFDQNRIDYPSQYGYNISETILACPGIGDTFLEELYNTQLLTDVVLEAKGKTFRAHKALLCARSHIFQSMLTNGEKNNDSIQVDLEDETVENFLRFLYCDKLENIPWESAVKLYHAAVKYGVQKLKEICSSILLDNIKISNAIQLHRLAVDHNDSELRKAVAYFILKYDVLDLNVEEEWKKFIQSEPSLVSTTLCQRCIRNLRYSR